jgi:dihydrofolate reductase
MRKVVLLMTVSLDGFIEGPERQLDWHRVDAEVERHVDDQLRTMGAFLYGRVCYELMAAFWPTAGADPASTARVVAFSRLWREMPKIVFSRTLERAEHNTTITRDVVIDEILALRAQPGGDLALAGADLTASFLRHDLIDEYRIYIHPVLLGRGKRLFSAADVTKNLRLIESRTFGNGVVFLRYERAEARSGAAE